MKGNLDENAKAIYMQCAAVTSDAASAASVDTRGFEECTFIVNVGAVTGTSPTLDISVQESSDDAVADAYADLAANSEFGATYTDSDATKTFVKSVNLTGDIERYLQLHFDVGGTTPSFLISAVAILSGAKELPVTQVNTAGARG